MGPPPSGQSRRWGWFGHERLLLEHLSPALLGVFIYLEDRMTKRGKDREVFPSLVQSRRWPQKPGLSQAQTRSLEFRLGFPRGWQGPRHLDRLPLLSQVHQKGAE